MYFRLSRSTYLPLLLTALLAVFGSQASLAYSGALQTILVPATTNSSTNGSALLNTIAGITDATANKPYLVKLEPGKYNLGSSQLVMKAYVDIEGSGRNATRIVGVPPTNSVVGYPATVVGAANTELRELAITSNGSGSSGATGLFVENGPKRLINVRIKASQAIVNDSLVLANSSPIFQDVEVLAAGGQSATAVVIEQFSEPSFNNCHLKASGATQTNRAVFLFDYFGGNIPRFEEVEIQASGGQRAYGLWGSDMTGTNDTQVSITHSTIDTRDATISNYGIYLESAYGMDLFASQVRAAGPTSYAVFTHQLGKQRRITNSQLTGDTGSAHGSPMTISATGLFGAGVTGGATCAGVFDDANAFYPSTCP